MDLFNRTVFVSGPPRSGTTFAARALNTHPAIFNYIDDHVHECWELYYYRTRVGLIQDIRMGRTVKEEARTRLASHILQGGRLHGIAPSDKTENSPPEPAPRRPGQPMNEADQKLLRHSIAMEDLPDEWRLCLKSPEISFVLLEIAALFPEAVFVLVYRPVVEIAESMYRKGLTVKKVAVYQRRWHEEKRDDGTLQPPPGVPTAWQPLWNQVSDFKRCAIYAASYMKSLSEGLAKLDPSRFFIYNHTDFRRQPERIIHMIAEFLNLPAAGFDGVGGLLDADAPSIPAGLGAEISELEKELRIKELETTIDGYCSHRTRT